MTDIKQDGSGRSSRRTPVAPTPQADLPLAPAPALAAAPVAQVPARVAMTPMDMLAIAVQRGDAADQLAKLWDIAEKVRQQQAQQAFVTAMNLFKQDPPTIEKTRKAKVDSKKGGDASFAYKYANLADVCAAVVRALSNVGISHSWATVQENGQVTVRCTLTHEQGHSASTMLAASLDATGGKNNLQALGSTVSYLERYTLLAVCGLAVDDEQDDDGASATGAELAELRSKAAEIRASASQQDQQGKSSLLSQARAEADKGHGAFGKFWKNITEAQRRELGAHLAGLQQRASSVKVP